MKKIHIGQLFPGKAHLPILYPHLGAIDKPQRLFFNFAKSFPDKLFDLTDDPAQADYLMIPHDFFSVASEKGYIQGYAALAEKYDKPILILDHSDFDEDIDLPHSIIFRASRYRSQMKPNEHIMPPISEDLGAGGISIRTKGESGGKGHTVVVGFCGWAGFGGLKDRARYFVKIISACAKSLLDSRAAARKPGLYFRRAAMAAVRRAERGAALKSNFIIRASYSGHSDTIGLDPAAARRQYIDNIIGSDFVLAPKGDGNYSNRFYEILSLGRIPVLIDTECVLPLESAADPADAIDYRDIIVRVPYKDVGRTDEYISRKYASLDGAGFAEMQRRARQAFKERLSVTSFFKNFFDRAAI